VRYDLGFYIQEDGIFHIHGRENLKSYMKEYLLAQNIIGLFTWNDYIKQQRVAALIKGDGPRLECVTSGLKTGELPTATCRSA
jgi:hypothetical protein